MTVGLQEDAKSTTTKQSGKSFAGHPVYLGNSFLERKVLIFSEYPSARHAQNVLGS